MDFSRLPDHMWLRPPGFSFAYSFRVPAEPRAPMEGRVAEVSAFERDHLLGPLPILEWVEYTPDPWRLYARVTLTASARRGAKWEGASFVVDRGLMTMLRPDDALHVTYDQRLGLSVLREYRLVAAAGAVSLVPLGIDVTARNPGDLVHRAEMIFRERDPHYHMFDHPIELTLGDATYILNQQRWMGGSYDIYVRRSRLFGEPCVSIERVKVCPETAAHTTADLLEKESLRKAGRSLDEDGDLAPTDEREFLTKLADKEGWSEEDRKGLEEYFELRKQILGDPDDPSGDQ